MKYLLPLAVALGLASRSTQAAPHPRVPLDTIPGHAQLVQTISEGLCGQLATESKSRDFRRQPPRQSGQLLKKITNQLVKENRHEVETLLYAVPSQLWGRYKRRLGRDILLHLADTCPAAHQLFADLNYQSLHDQSPLPEAEQAVLLPIAWRISRRLAEEDRRDPLEGRLAAEEQQLIIRVIKEELQAATPYLADYYGKEVVSDPTRWRNVGERMGFLLYNLSPKYLLMLSPRPDY